MQIVDTKVPVYNPNGPLLNVFFIPIVFYRRLGGIRTEWS